MGIRSFLSKPIASWIVHQQKKWTADGIAYQEKWMKHLIQKARHTAFGKDHRFETIKSYHDFKNQIPLGDYEALSPYIKRIITGEKDVLWPELPLYFAKTSGTTSGVKYIPITKDSISNHIHSARNALLNYIHETGHSSFLDGKLIFLSGSPELDTKGKIPTGRLSGIVNHHVPSYLRTNQMPDYNTNCIEDWEEKLDRIVDQTCTKNMTLISGIPPWVQMYFDRIQERTGKKIKDVFPDFSLFIYGGVNFEPYRAKLTDSIGKKIDSIELYPASEGFIAFQDSQHEEGLLLLLNTGIFYEFIRTEDYFSDRPNRISIADVELGVNYAIIINNNAGLWGYSLGDTVKFVSKNPYRIVVTGRIKHFISAFGEHVIGEEVEKAMKATLEKFSTVQVIEFTVAPQVTPSEGGLPHHEWFIEFANPPADLNLFAEELNQHLQRLNVYYDDLIKGHILCRLKISVLQSNGFQNMMKAEGKLGGQNKVPRLSNDRTIANQLSVYKLKIN